MNILGLSCFYHDAGACLLHDGELVAAAEEERFTRLKHDASLPLHAANYCLEAADVDPDQLDYVIFYEKPLLKFERIVAGYAATFPRSRGAFVKAMQTWLSQKLWVRGQIADGLGFDGAVLFGEHHLSHAASAFFPSPFTDSAVLTADGVGEWASTTLGIGDDMDLELSHEIRYPHSLGLLYSAFTAYLGFEVNEGEYKVMGMAAYGRPRYVDKVRRLISIMEDGSYRLDMRYLAYQHGLRSIDTAFIDLFGPAREPGAELEERFANIAASIQVVTEDAMLALARRARQLSGSENLCMAGGVALNVLANARILRESGFLRVWIQPAAGDAGGCLGAALYLHHTILRNPRRYRMDTAYVGPGYSNAEIHSFLEQEGVPFSVLDDMDIAPCVARLLADNNVVGWFQGRMEFGPRALGARSILANPTDPTTKDTLNAKIKHREAFRPFAPSTLLEAASTYFDFGSPGGHVESPFMLLTARVRPDKHHLLPAITHVDGTARVQTVSRAQNPLYYALIEEFGKLTGVPVLVNTSFNVQGEPIVCTPAEAFNSFAHTDMDYLVLGNALVPASSKRKLGAYPGTTLVHAGEEVVA